MKRSVPGAILVGLLAGCGPLLDFDLPAGGTQGAYLRDRGECEQKAGYPLPLDSPSLPMTAYPTYGPVRGPFGTPQVDAVAESVMLSRRAVVQRVFVDCMEARGYRLK